MISSSKGRKDRSYHYVRAARFSNGRPWKSPGQLKVLPSILNSDLRVPSAIVRRHCLKTSSNELVSRQFCEERKEKI